MVTNRIIRKVKNVPKLKFWRILGVLIVFMIFLPHICYLFKSLGPQEYSEIVFLIFGHHQEDQEGQECPKTGVLEDFRCLDGVYDIFTPHMIPF